MTSKSFTVGLAKAFGLKTAPGAMERMKSSTRREHEWMYSGFLAGRGSSFGEGFAAEGPTLVARRLSGPLPIGRPMKSVGRQGVRPGARDLLRGTEKSLLLISNTRFWKTM